MHLDISKYLLVLIGWLIRQSYELECIQCTSRTQRISQSWDHSCLDGTLAPVLCQDSTTESELEYQQCMSSVYRLSNQKHSGAHIYRGCTKIPIVQRDCDPPNSTNDFLDRTSAFYCSQTCFGNGCNRHTVKEITSHACELLFPTKLILLYLICAFYFPDKLVF